MQGWIPSKGFEFAAKFKTLTECFLFSLILINEFSAIFDFTLLLFCVYYKRIQKL